MSSDIERLKAARAPTYERLDAAIASARKASQEALTKQIDKLNQEAELEILALESPPDYSPSEYLAHNQRHHPLDTTS
jgi:hypothetical protein